MVNTQSVSPTTSGETSIFSSTANSRIFFSRGTSRGKRGYLGVPPARGL